MSGYQGNPDVTLPAIRRTGTGPDTRGDYPPSPQRPGAVRGLNQPSSTAPPLQHFQYRYAPSQPPSGSAQGPAQQSTGATTARRRGGAPLRQGGVSLAPLALETGGERGGSHYLERRHNLQILRPPTNTYAWPAQGQPTPAPVSGRGAGAPTTARASAHVGSHHGGPAAHPNAASASASASSSSASGSGGPAAGSAGALGYHPDGSPRALVGPNALVPLSGHGAGPHGAHGHMQEYPGDAGSLTLAQAAAAGQHSAHAAARKELVAFLSNPMVCQLFSRAEAPVLVDEAAAAQLLAAAPAAPADVVTLVAALNGAGHAFASMAELAAALSAAHAAAVQRAATDALVASVSETDRQLVLAHLTAPACRLFAGAELVQATAAQLSRLIVEAAGPGAGPGGDVAAALRLLDGLNARGRSFLSFDHLIFAVSAARLQQAALDRVAGDLLHFLQRPDCPLFDAAGTSAASGAPAVCVVVTAQDVQDLIARSGAGVDTLTHVRALARARVTVTALPQLAALVARAHQDAVRRRKLYYLSDYSMTVTDLQRQELLSFFHTAAYRLFPAAAAAAALSTPAAPPSFADAAVAGAGQGPNGSNPNNGDDAGAVGSAAAAAVGSSSNALVEASGATGGQAPPGSLAVTADELDALLVQARGLLACKHHLTALMDAGRTFASFAELIAAVQAAHTALKVQLLDLLQSPTGSALLSGAGAVSTASLTVADVDQFLAESRAGPAALYHLHLLHAQGVRCRLLVPELAQAVLAAHVAALNAQVEARLATLGYLFSPACALLQRGARASDLDVRRLFDQGGEDTRALLEALDCSGRTFPSMATLVEEVRRERAATAAHRRDLLAHLTSPQCRLFEGVHVVADASSSAALAGLASAATAPARAPPRINAASVPTTSASSGMSYALVATGNDDGADADADAAAVAGFPAQQQQRAANAISGGDSGAPAGAAASMSSALTLPADYPHAFAAMLDGPGADSGAGNGSGGASPYRSAAQLSALSAGSLTTASGEALVVINAATVDRLYHEGGAGAATLHALWALDVRRDRFRSWEALTAAVRATRSNVLTQRHAARAVVLAHLRQPDTRVLAQGAAAAGDADADALLAAAASSADECVMYLRVLEAAGVLAPTTAALADAVAAERAASIANKARLLAFLRSPRCVLFSDSPALSAASAAVDGEDAVVPALLTPEDAARIYVESGAGPFALGVLAVLNNAALELLRGAGAGDDDDATAASSNALVVSGDGADDSRGALMQVSPALRGRRLRSLGTVIAAVRSEHARALAAQRLLAAFCAAQAALPALDAYEGCDAALARPVAPAAVFAAAVLGRAAAAAAAVGAVSSSPSLADSALDGPLSSAFVSSLGLDARAIFTPAGVSSLRALTPRQLHLVARRAATLAPADLARYLAHLRAHGAVFGSLAALAQAVATLAQRDRAVAAAGALAVLARVRAPASAVLPAQAAADSNTVSAADFGATGAFTVTIAHEGNARFAAAGYAESASAVCVQDACAVLAAADGDAALALATLDGFEAQIKRAAAAAAVPQQRAASGSAIDAVPVLAAPSARRPFASVAALVAAVAAATAQRHARVRALEAALGPDAGASALPSVFPSGGAGLVPAEGSLRRSVARELAAALPTDFPTAAAAGFLRRARASAAAANTAAFPGGWPELRAAVEAFVEGRRAADEAAARDVLAFLTRPESALLRGADGSAASAACLLDVHVRQLVAAAHGSGPACLAALHRVEDVVLSHNAAAAEARGGATVVTPDWDVATVDGLAAAVNAVTTLSPADAAAARAFLTATPMLSAAARASVTDETVAELNVLCVSLEGPSLPATLPVAVRAHAALVAAGNLSLLRPQTENNNSDNGNDAAAANNGDSALETVEELSELLRAVAARLAHRREDVAARVHAWLTDRPAPAAASTGSGGESDALDAALSDETLFGAIVPASLTQHLSGAAPVPACALFRQAPQVARHLTHLQTLVALRHAARAFLTPQAVGAAADARDTSAAAAALAAGNASGVFAAAAGGASSAALSDSAALFAGLPAATPGSAVTTGLGSAAFLFASAAAPFGFAAAAAGAGSAAVGDAAAAASALGLQDRPQAYHPISPAEAAAAAAAADARSAHGEADGDGELEGFNAVALLAPAPPAMRLTVALPAPSVPTTPAGAAGPVALHRAAAASAVTAATVTPLNATSSGAASSSAAPAAGAWARALSSAALSASASQEHVAFELALFHLHHLSAAGFRALSLSALADALRRQHQSFLLQARALLAHLTDPRCTLFLGASPPVAVAMPDVLDVMADVYARSPPLFSPSSPAFDMVIQLWGLQAQDRRFSSLAECYAALVEAAQAAAERRREGISRIRDAIVTCMPPSYAPPASAVATTKGGASQTGTASVKGEPAAATVPEGGDAATQAQGGAPAAAPAPAGEDTSLAAAADAAIVEMQAEHGLPELTPEPSSASVAALPVASGPQSDEGDAHGLFVEEAFPLVLPDALLHAVYDLCGKDAAAAVRVVACVAAEAGPVFVSMYHLVQAIANYTIVLEDQTRYALAALTTAPRAAAGPAPAYAGLLAPGALPSGRAPFPAEVASMIAHAQSGLCSALALQRLAARGETFASLAALTPALAAEAQRLRSLYAEMLALLRQPQTTLLALAQPGLAAALSFAHARALVRCAVPAMPAAAPIADTLAPGPEETALRVLRELCQRGLKTGSVAALCAEVKLYARQLGAALPHLRAQLQLVAPALGDLSAAAPAAADSAAAPEGAEEAKSAGELVWSLWGAFALQHAAQTGLDTAALVDALAAAAAARSALAPSEAAANEGGLDAVPSVARALDSLGSRPALAAAVRAEAEARRQARREEIEALRAEARALATGPASAASSAPGQTQMAQQQDTSKMTVDELAMMSPLAALASTSSAGPSAAFTYDAHSPSAAAGNTAAGATPMTAAAVVDATIEQIRAFVASPQALPLFPYVYVHPSSAGSASASAGSAASQAAVSSEPAGEVVVPRLLSDSDEAFSAPASGADAGDDGAEARAAAARGLIRVRRRPADLEEVSTSEASRLYYDSEALGATLEGLQELTDRSAHAEQARVALRQQAALRTEDMGQLEEALRQAEAARTAALDAALQWAEPTAEQHAHTAEALARLDRRAGRLRAQLATTQQAVEATRRALALAPEPETFGSLAALVEGLRRCQQERKQTALALLRVKIEEVKERSREAALYQLKPSSVDGAVSLQPVTRLVAVPGQAPVSVPALAPGAVSDADRLAVAQYLSHPRCGLFAGAGPEGVTLTGADITALLAVSGGRARCLAHLLSLDHQQRLFASPATLLAAVAREHAQLAQRKRQLLLYVLGPKCQLLSRKAKLALSAGHAEALLLMSQTGGDPSALKLVVHVLDELQAVMREAKYASASASASSAANAAPAAEEDDGYGGYGSAAASGGYGRSSASAAGSSDVTLDALDSPEELLHAVGQAWPAHAAAQRAIAEQEDHMRRRLDARAQQRAFTVLSQFLADPACVLFSRTLQAVAVTEKALARVLKGAGGDVAATLVALREMQGRPGPVGVPARAFARAAALASAGRLGLPPSQAAATARELLESVSAGRWLPVYCDSMEHLALETERWVAAWVPLQAQVLEYLSAPAVQHALFVPPYAVPLATDAEGGAGALTAFFTVTPSQVVDLWTRGLAGRTTLSELVRLVEARVRARSAPATGGSNDAASVPVPGPFASLAALATYIAGRQRVRLTVESRWRQLVVGVRDAVFLARRRDAVAAGRAAVRAALVDRQCDLFTPGTLLSATGADLALLCETTEVAARAVATELSLARDLGVPLREYVRSYDSTATGTVSVPGEPEPVALPEPTAESLEFTARGGFAPGSLFGYYFSLLRWLTHTAAPGMRTPYLAPLPSFAALLVAVRALVDASIFPAQQASVAMPPQAAQAVAVVVSEAIADAAFRATADAQLSLQGRPAGATAPPVSAIPTLPPACAVVVGASLATLSAPSLSLVPVAPHAERMVPVAVAATARLAGGLRALLSTANASSAASVVLQVALTDAAADAADADPTIGSSSASSGAGADAVSRPRCTAASSPLTATAPASTVLTVLLSASPLSLAAALEAALAARAGAPLHATFALVLADAAGIAVSGAAALAETAEPVPLAQLLLARAAGVAIAVPLVSGESRTHAGELLLTAAMGESPADAGSSDAVPADAAKRASAESDAFARAALAAYGAPGAAAAAAPRCLVRASCCALSLAPLSGTITLRVAGADGKATAQTAFVPATTAADDAAQTITFEAPLLFPAGAAARVEVLLRAPAAEGAAPNSGAVSLLGFVELSAEALAAPAVTAPLLAPAKPQVNFAQPAPQPQPLNAGRAFLRLARVPLPGSFESLPEAYAAAAASQGGAVSAAPELAEPAGPLVHSEYGAATPQAALIAAALSRPLPPPTGPLPAALVDAVTVVRGGGLLNADGLRELRAHARTLGAATAPAPVPSATAAGGAQTWEPTEGVSLAVVDAPAPSASAGTDAAASADFAEAEERVLAAHLLSVADGRSAAALAAVRVLSEAHAQRRAQPAGSLAELKAAVWHAHLRAAAVTALTTPYAAETIAAAAAAVAAVSAAPGSPTSSLPQPADASVLAGVDPEGEGAAAAVAAAAATAADPRSAELVAAVAAAPFDVMAELWLAGGGAADSFALALVGLIVEARRALSRAAALPAAATAAGAASLPPPVLALQDPAALARGVARVRAAQARATLAPRAAHAIQAFLARPGVSLLQSAKALASSANVGSSKSTSDFAAAFEHATTLPAPTPAPAPVVPVSAAPTPRPSATPRPSGSSLASDQPPALTASEALALHRACGAAHTDLALWSGAAGAGQGSLAARADEEALETTLRVLWRLSVQQQSFATAAELTARAAEVAVASHGARVSASQREALRRGMRALCATAEDDSTCPRAVVSALNHAYGELSRVAAAAQVIETAGSLEAALAAMRGWYARAVSSAAAAAAAASASAAAATPSSPATRAASPAMLSRAMSPAAGATAPAAPSFAFPATVDAMLAALQAWVAEMADASAAAATALRREEARVVFSGAHEGVEPALAAQAAALAAAVTPAAAWRLAVGTGAGTALPTVVAALVRERTNVADGARRSMPVRPVASMDDLQTALQDMWAVIRTEKM